MNRENAADLFRVLGTAWARMYKYELNEDKDKFIRGVTAAIIEYQSGNRDSAMNLSDEYGGSFADGAEIGLMLAAAQKMEQSKYRFG